MRPWWSELVLVLGGHGVDIHIIMSTIIHYSLLTCLVSMFSEFLSLASAGVTGVGTMDEMEETLAMTYTMTDQQVVQTATGMTSEDPEILPIVAMDIVTHTTMKDMTDPDHDRVGVFVGQIFNFDSVGLLHVHGIQSTQGSTLSFSASLHLP